MKRREFLAAGSTVAALTSAKFIIGKASMPMVRDSRYKDQPSVVLENGTIRAEFVTQGGRMVSLREKATDEEFLFQQDGAKYIRAEYGKQMANDQAAGYDDMFPTIGECTYQQFPWKGTPLPDHGEVW